MIFHTIHNQSPPVQFKEALFNGMAPDGSLYFPGHLPNLSFEKIINDQNASLHSIGVDVVNRFIEEIPLYALVGIVKHAWNFPIPLKQLENDLFLLELFHGPTLAFKDVGARFMAGVMSYFLEKDSHDISILVATSGDTGSAVASGFHDAPHVNVFVLYPSGKISALQEKQITTLGGNIHPIEVEGTFDDCQRLVKEVFRDQKLLAKRRLTTANSINIARLIPQIVYYFWANAQLSKYCDLRYVSPEITVPSGNFGNLTAAIYAKEMGNPTRKFIAATNANDVVPKYLTTGHYEPKPSLQTLSNAMDVGAPSNLVRIRELYKNNLAMMKENIEAVSVTDGATLEEIRRTYHQYNCIVDPHTAVGIAAARKFREQHVPTSPMIVVSTAHPGKFPDTIKQALGIDIELPKQLTDVLKKSKNTVKIGNNYKELKEVLIH